MTIIGKRNDNNNNNDDDDDLFISSVHLYMTMIRCAFLNYKYEKSKK